MNNLIVLMGNTICQYHLDRLSDTSDTDLYFIDSELRPEHVSISNNRITYIDYNSREFNISNEIEALEYIKNVIIISCFESGKDIKSNCFIVTQRKIIQFIKAVYLMAMHTTGIRFWFLSPKIQEDTDQEFRIWGSAFNEAINALSKVLALELEKKKVITNNIIYSCDAKLLGFFELIDDLSLHSLYMNIASIEI